MNTNELLERIKQRDMDAYLQLTQDYGWKLYSYLRTQCADQKTTDAVFDQTLKDFYKSMTSENTEDAMESVLYTYADLTIARLKKEHSRSGFGFWIALFVLIVGILAAFWVILGLLMDMGFLAELDLGYSWFNTHIANWF